MNNNDELLDLFFSNAFVRCFKHVFHHTDHSPVTVFILKSWHRLLKLNYSNKLLVGTLALIVISSSFGNVFAQNGLLPDGYDTGRYSFADPSGQGAREGAPTDDRYRPYSSENTSNQSPNVATFGVEASLLDGCNCVVFRLDDVQDYWLSDVQVTVMDQFVQKNQYLSAGPIVGLFGADANVVNKAIAGYNSGLFEIFVHGWDHVDYSTLNLATQTSTLQDSQNKLQLLFGSPSTVFIPPFNTFNTDTLTSLQSTGFNIISAAEWSDSYPYFIADGSSDIVDSNGVYHLPESIGFTDWIDGAPVQVPNSQILAAIDSSIASKGYAVVTVHSQEFAQVQGGSEINVVDQSKLSNLNSIIDGVIAKNYPIRTFSQVVEFNQSPPQDTESPVIAAHSDVNAAATSQSGATVSYTSPATSDNIDAPGVATCSPLSDTTFAIGTTTVTCNATDTAGNPAIPTTFDVIVSEVPDTESPVIAAHSDVNAAATSQSGATVSYTSPATSDNIDAPGVATCSPLSDTTFAIGTTTVTCNATDTAGNPAIPTTFDVIVSEVPDAQTPIAGWRSSQYGDYLPTGHDQSDPDYWTSVAQQMSAKFQGFTPGGVLVIGEIDGAPGTATSTFLPFPKPTGTYPNVNFGTTDVIEPLLDAYDSAGLKVFLQVESADADIPMLMNLIMDRYKHHPSVIGFGVDVEWYHEAQFPGFGRPVTDSEVNAWAAQVKTFDPNYDLMIKHWDFAYLSNARPDNVLFLTDSENVGSLSVITNEYIAWIDHFGDSQVGFQIGYPSDISWWGSLNDPASEIINPVITARPNANIGAIFWVDFSVLAAFPDIGNPAITINDVTQTEGNSGTKNFVFTVTRSVNTPAISVQYQTVDDNAIAPIDYTSIPLTTLNFADNGSLTQTITVSVNGDSTVESNEAFNINLSNCVGCTNADNQGVGTITNDDSPPQDTESPVIAAHSDVNAAATSQSGATVSYTSPATSDNIDAPGVATCSPLSDTTFAIGTTTVTCNATDTAGNPAIPTTFDVIVSEVPDTESPVIAAHSDVNAAATSQSGATVSYTSPATSDNIDAPGVAICSPLSDTTFAIGTTTVTCNATDTAGNPAIPTTFDVIVSDVPVNPILFSDTFESGFAKWTETGEGDWKLESPNEKQVPGHSSNLVAHSDNCDSTCTITMSNSIDLSSSSSATLSFWRYVDNELDNGEYLKVELYDGSQWNTISNWTNNAGDDDTWHQETVNLDSYLDTSDFNVRFVTHESSNREIVEIDDVIIDTSDPSPFPQDTESPVIATHSDVNAAATSQSGATVSYTSPATSDNIDAPGVATCSPLSDTTFAIGTTTVTCNATDTAGNPAIPTTFDVIVSEVPVNPILFSDTFESGFAKWTETGEGDWKLESPDEKQVPGHSSNLVVHSDNCDSTCTITMSNSIDLSSSSSATLSFWRYVDKDLDNGEYLKVELYDGSQWNTISNWTNNAGDDDTWHQETVNLDSYLDTSDFNVRFVTHESHQKEIVEVDDVEITALS